MILANSWMNATSGRNQSTWMTWMPLTKISIWNFRSAGSVTLTWNEKKILMMND